MKTLIAMCLAVALLITAGYTAQTTVTEKLSQTCSNSDSYQNTWRDVYFIGDWLPHLDDSKSFIQCSGPSDYIRYHPVDIAAVSFVGALIAGLVIYRSEKLYTKNPTKKVK